MSQNIIIKKGSNTITSIHELCIRITLNNGVTALLGLSSANKNSCVCLKVQQDNVRGNKIDFLLQNIYKQKHTYI